ncbi:MAG: hypothetical protein GJ677_10720 [Rhodobacteraceae bacterium]|nr:hypothetical protein [Paracoccaceae bacterium]
MLQGKANNFVVLSKDDVERWIMRLQEIPDFIQSDELVLLFIDILSTTEDAQNVEPIEGSDQSIPAPRLVH